MPLKARIAGTQLQVGGPIGPLLHLTANSPLTDEQWTAIEQLTIRGFNLVGKGFGDAALPRLAKLDPSALMFWEVPMTDAGAEHFTSMKSLRVLTLVHAGGAITTKTAHTIENHPSLEVLCAPGSWVGDPETFARIVTSCKRLRAIPLAHQQGSDSNCKIFAHHPALEDLWLWPDSGLHLTDAGVVSLSTLPKLKKLWLEYSRVTYDGGLKHLKNVADLESLKLTNMLVSDEDLARLQADLPNVKITFTPMKPEHRAKFERWETTRDRANELEKLPEAERAAKLTEIQKRDSTLFQAVNAELRRRQPSPKK